MAERQSREREKEGGGEGDGRGGRGGQCLKKEKEEGGTL